MASAVHHSNSTQPYVWHDEFYIGPPSQPVDIANFLSSAVNTSPRNVLDPAQEIDGDALATRCSVDNLKEELDQLLSLPDVSGYIKRRQNMAAQRLFDLAQGHTEGSDEPKGRATKSRKRERSEEHNESESLVLSAGASDPVPEVAYVREELERLNLQMNARYTLDAVLSVVPS
ncbi:hypothetical protein CALCODRAFT_479439 [Calocera cornea HHB12733]|uniref:Uncharacterized protein n=1 Tax=Calocera cornea HHB12733 TaxID=1353952 RepID=A0A165JKA1_9BASI|nr:hypothetical protein CALCODRAFT_479439 [Calocera cornea HHB12733]